MKTIASDAGRMIETKERPIYNPRIEAMRRFAFSLEALTTSAEVSAIAFYDMALTAKQIATVMHAMSLLPYRIPLRVAFWRWLVLWMAVVALTWWGSL